MQSLVKEFKIESSDYMRRGILGGSFNPPHELHLRQAVEILKNNMADVITFVPNISNPYHTKNLIDPIHRYNMVKLMIKGYTNMEVSDVDLKKGKPSYTYETLDELHKIYPNDELMFIIGSDNLKEINHWGKYEYLLSTYKIIVTKRGEDDIETIFKQNTYLEQYRKNIIPFNNFKTSDLSSTFIRELLMDKKNVSDYLTKEVYQYIIDNNLYR